MKCDLCGKAEALIYIQQEALNVKTELRLCPSCAASQGLSSIDGELKKSLSKLMESVGHPADAKSAPTKAAAADAKKCPVCGATFAELRKRGLAGCSGCWKSFGSALTLSRDSHVSRQYRGRLPLRLESFRSLVSELSELRDKLKIAIKAEDYESAAQCRDRIRSLEEESTRAR